MVGGGYPFGLASPFAKASEGQERGNASGWRYNDLRIRKTGLTETIVGYYMIDHVMHHVIDLQFWDMIWGPPEYIDAGKALVEQFNQEHPDITVTYRSIPWTNWYQTLVTAIGSGTAPDISTGAGYQAVQLYDQGAILPIDDVISQWKSDGKLDDFLPNTVDILKYDNHYVALPWAIDIRVWYYRKDLLAACRRDGWGSERLIEEE